MSVTHSAISVVVACICGQHDYTAASKQSSTFSTIPQTVHFGKYHITTSLPKLQPVSDTLWRKKARFDQLISVHVALNRQFSHLTMIFSYWGCKSVDMATGVRDINRIRPNKVIGIVNLSRWQRDSVTSTGLDQIFELEIFGYVHYPVRNVWVPTHL